ncbi:putative ABC transport system ATP-binding protein [Peptoniphilus asaccharolyticus DSM 20463]|uniref:Putative ABC transport system ATP-binding protein n=1 Tax=Peptoniphilus asaccharolyticus DSM 20463 TaxID=573058 RepID=A0A1W1V6S1_PEPAS|nr:ABC transporter ATP-binding protein [Peptoniphilus asaccharolyticus]MBL7575962.1 ABC transporter ATP-binding protein [Peptoniphilus asaccharolyticus]SMB89149.1 putative ABC transport system ATP-binding protein [Peptoniphilus asaccharolyticus DSM 20463]
MDSFIETKNLTKIYKMGDSSVYALNDVNLKINKGQIVCLLGTSGSGKSTLLNILAGLDKPTSGEVLIGGINIVNLNEDQITKFRQLNVGFVFQSYNLIPTLDASENVSLGLTFKGVSKSKRNEFAKDILTKVGLGDRLRHKPNEMSGGQQQRVSIARAFVDSPPIVFADEPTGNLDSKTSDDIMQLMCSISRKHNQTLIIVTHDVETSVYADVIIHMKDGKIINVEDNESIIS